MLLTTASDADGRFVHWPDGLDRGEQVNQMLKYRPDIDGLRAIAVLAVVLYHYGIGALPGGFVGVDIFFVISGYLITGIIQKEIERGVFTFSGFYERRIRRIFPALFAMLLATLFVGAWVLLPSDLVRLGNGTFATLLFASNVLFWRQSGYFDTGSEYNPLLHTWSLAVEEQFYIGLPILLILLHRYVKGWLKPTLVVCTIVSFALCVWIQGLRPSATFFLSPFRAWELLLGGWLAVGVVPAIRSARMRLVVSAVALLLLLWSLWWIKAGPAFPGWQAALPVLATAALLHAGAQGSSPVQRLLSLRPLVFVGLISYSLYLWHWPLAVFVRYRNAMAPLAPGEGWGLLVVAVLLAAASYHWVETPFRHRKSSTAGARPVRLFAAAAGMTAALAAVSVIAKLDHGWQARFSPEVVALDQARRPTIPFIECNGRTPDFDSKACRIGDEDAPLRILLWGDSHALALAPGLDPLLKAQGTAAILAVNSACPPLLGVHNPVFSACHADNERLMETARTHRFDAIVLVASWNSYSSPHGQYTLFDDWGVIGNLDVFAPALERTLTKARLLADRLILIGPTPGAPDDIPFALGNALRWHSAPPVAKSMNVVATDSRWFWQAAKHHQTDSRLLLIDPTPWFCDKQACRYASETGELLYRDGGHLSEAGAQFVAERLSADALNPAAQSARAR